MLSYAAKPHFRWNIRSVLNIHGFSLLLEDISVGVIGEIRIYQRIISLETYLKQAVHDGLTSAEAVRDAVVEGGCRRIRACLITTATTILALLPVLTSSGRGADIMVPMAIPAFGGMLFEVITMFVVPVLFCLVREAKLQMCRNPVG